MPGIGERSRRRPGGLIPGAIISALYLLQSLAASQHLPHAPSLSVHECRYGTARSGERSESVQELEVRIVSYDSPGTRFTVQVFFLRRSPHGEAPAIDDTVLFTVTDPHATYAVSAKPIKVRGPSASPQKVASPAKTTPSATIAKYPREGYVVRVLHDGIVVREHASSHAVESFLRTHPELLDRAAGKKSARHLEASELLKR